MLRAVTHSLAADRTTQPLTAVPRRASPRVDEGRAPRCSYDEPYRLEVAGPLVSGTAGELRERARAAVAPTCLVLDLRRLSALDEAGIGVLLGALRSVREAGGSARVEVLPTWFARLRATGIARLADVALVGNAYDATD